MLGRWKCNVTMHEVMIRGEGTSKTQSRSHWLIPYLKPDSRFLPTLLLVELIRVSRSRKARLITRNFETRRKESTRLKYLVEEWNRLCSVIALYLWYRSYETSLISNFESVGFFEIPFLSSLIIHRLCNSRRETRNDQETDSPVKQLLFRSNMIHKGATPSYIGS